MAGLDALAGTTPSALGLRPAQRAVGCGASPAEGLRKAQRNRSQSLQPESLALADYTLVLSSLPPRQLSPRAALELYRCRWQVELAFKRLKSLLAAGHVPKRDDASAKSRMQAKFLTALLIERVLLEAKLFFTWGYALE